MLYSNMVIIDHFQLSDCPMYIRVRHILSSC